MEQYAHFTTKVLSDRSRTENARRNTTVQLSTPYTDLIPSNSPAALEP